MPPKLTKANLRSLIINYYLDLEKINKVPKNKDITYWNAVSLNLDTLRSRFNEIKQLYKKETEGVPYTAEATPVKKRTSFNV